MPVLKTTLLFKFVLLLSFIFSFLACQELPKNEEQSKPNIVLIFIDDMGYADVSSFGATDYTTPNIDKLAHEGVRFTNFYASQAVCSASRASLLTGCYAERVGIQGALNANSNIGLNADELIIPEMLKELGYATGIFGKWHLGHYQEFLPLQHGFDEYVGLPYSNDMWPVGFDGVALDGTGKRKSNYPPLPLFEGNEVIDTIATLEDQAKLTTLYTEKAVNFIRKHKNESFFLYMPHSMVHVPIAVSEKFKGKSGKGLFADVMLELDWSVGEISKALKENGLDDNTLIIFTSDNGPWLNFGNHAGSAGALREGKGSMWEGGVRVSTAMRWPGRIPAGIESEQIAATIDVLPTLAAITGAIMPENKIDGVNIISLMEGLKVPKPRDRFYYYYGGELIAVRHNNWKLVFPHSYRSYQGVEPGHDGFPGPYAKGIITEPELYNLAEDLSETSNLAAEHPEIVNKLMIIGDSARSDLGDRIKNIKGKSVRKSGRRMQEHEIINHLAIDKSITIKNKAAYQYSGHGDKTLINGTLGSYDYADEEWLGFHGVDFEAIIDLEEEMTVEYIECGFLINQGSWIFSPQQVIISTSTDSIDFIVRNRFEINAGERNLTQEVERFKLAIAESSIRYVKISARNIATCPDWHDGAGSKSWLFIDEIIIR